MNIDLDGRDVTTIGHALAHFFLISHDSSGWEDGPYTGPGVLELAKMFGVFEFVKTEIIKELAAKRATAREAIEEAEDLEIELMADISEVEKNWPFGSSWDVELAKQNAGFIRNSLGDC